MSTFEKVTLIYFGGMSIITFILMGVDKWKATKQRYRIPERTLFLWAILGGAIGGLIGMYTFRHKTKHMVFVIGFLLIVIIHGMILLFIQTGANG